MTSSESSRLPPRIVPQFEAPLTPLSQLPPKQQKLAKAAMKSELNALFKSVMGAQRDLKANRP